MAVALRALPKTKPLFVNINPNNIWRDQIADVAKSHNYDQERMVNCQSPESLTGNVLKKIQGSEGKVKLLVSSVITKPLGNRGEFFRQTINGLKELMTKAKDKIEALYLTFTSGYPTNLISPSAISASELKPINLEDLKKVKLEALEPSEASQKFGEPDIGIEKRINKLLHKDPLKSKAFVHPVAQFDIKNIKTMLDKVAA